MIRILIIGAGGWGTALGLLLQSKGYSVTIWGRNKDYIEQIKKSHENTKYLPGIKIPSAIDFISNEAVNDYDSYVIAVPVQYIRGIIGRLSASLKKNLLFISASKGLEIDTLQRPSQIIKSLLGNVKVCTLSGPSHGQEVARSLPTSVVAASDDTASSEETRKLFMCNSFRVYTSNDQVGVEFAGALKNIIAIAAGICDTLNLGDNAKASLISRGLAEIARLGIKLGADVKTFFGLAGVGDLITTCHSCHGRNLYVGRQIGTGKKLDEILSSMQMVAEGVYTTKATCLLARENGVEMPITGQIYNILFEGKRPIDALNELMTRDPKP